MQDTLKKPHNLILDSRKKLSLSGVEDVSGFNEETVSLTTEMGGLVIRGSDLHISKLNLDTGEVEIEGMINSLQYIQSRQNKSFMQRIFN
ncbi:MAG: sporulation protein YabP [Ruminococcus sp.]